MKVTRGPEAGLHNLSWIKSVLKQSQTYSNWMFGIGDLMSLILSDTFSCVAVVSHICMCIFACACGGNSRWVGWSVVFALVSLNNWIWGNMSLRSRKSSKPCSTYILWVHNIHALHVTLLCRGGGGGVLSPDNVCDVIYICYFNKRCPRPLT